MTVIVTRNMNCNKGLIATQAKPVCIILHSIKEITSDERKTLNDPGYTLSTFPKVTKYNYEPKEKHLCEQRKQEEASLHNSLKEKALCIVGLGAQQPLEGNFLPGILEGLVGGLGLNRAVEGKFPASTRQGVARMWATVVQSSAELTGPRDVRLEPAEGIPRGLHLDYEDYFLTSLVSVIPRVFSDPKSLLHLASLVFSLAGS